VPERQRALVIPSLPSAPLQQNNKSAAEQQGVISVPVAPDAPLQQNNKPILKRQGAIKNPILYSNSKLQTTALNEARIETVNTFDKMTQAANDNMLDRYSSFVRR
jgi:hypothetical protein